MPHYPDEIEYSDKYYDELFEYRHVQLPKNIFKAMPKGRLLTENEWRSLGVQQSRGWVHYEIHKPEPYILLFRRPRNTDPNTGIAPPEIMEKINLYQKQIEEMKKKIKPEPNKNDPNSTLIVLRYPNGEQRVERRFLKTDIIQDLYNFVSSLGREIYTESENNGFSIIQPFPPKQFNEMNKTLEEEGLVPNALLQIKEN
jgi:cyclin-dependent kinase regulatory subunit CKS1